MMMSEPLRILMLEDNPVDAELIQFELREAGLDFNAKLVMTEKDFIREIQEFCPDLILSDYDLPKYNGALALEEAKKSSPDVPFILVTGAVTEDRAIEILTGGAKDYVMKSRLGRLAPAVRRVLAEAEEQKARKRAEEELRIAHAELELKVRERTAALEAEIEERKQTEQALRERELQLQAVLDNSPDAIFLKDRNSRLLMANPATFAIIGKPPAACLGKTDMEFYDDPATGRATMENDRRIIESGRMEVVEETVFAREGNRVYLSTKAPFRDADGNIVGLIGISRDITERKLVERVLIEREERFHLLAKTSGRLLRAEEPQIIVQEICQDVMSYLDCQAFFNFLADEQGNRLHLNAYAGITDDKAKDVEWLDFGVAVCGCVAQARQRIIAEDILNSSDARNDLIKSFGIQAYCCHPLMAQDHLIGTLSFGTKKRTNFTHDEIEIMRVVADQVAVAMQRRQTERLLRQRESDLAESQRLASLGSWTYDMNTKSVNWSDELYKIFDIEKEEFEGLYKSFLSRVLPEDKEKVLDTNRQTIVSGEPFEIEYRILTRNNQVRHIREVGYARKDEFGRISGSFGTAQDITKQKQVELAQKESEKQLRALSDNLAATIKAIPDLRFEVDREGRICDYGAPNYLNLSVSPANFMGKRVDEVLPLEAATTIMQAIADASVRGWHFGATYALPMKGGLNWFELSIAIKGDQEAPNARFIILARNITERQKAEEALKESEERYKAFAEQSFAGVYLLMNGRFVFINKNAASYAGYQPEELIGKRADDLIHPEDLTEAKETARKMLRGEGSSPYEFRVITKDGQIRWIIETVTYVKHGDLKAILGNSMDITYRKWSEEALEASRKLEMSIFSSVAHGLFGVENRKIFFANEAMEQVFGWKPEELIGKSTRIIFRNDKEWEEYGANLYSMMREETVVSFEPHNLFVRKDGKEIYCSNRVSRIGDYLDENKRIVATFEDITERKAAENALRESEEQFRAMFELASIGVGQSDPQTRRLLRVNRKLCDITGYSSEELLSMGAPDFIHPDDRDKEKENEQFNRLLSGEIPNYRIEKRYIRKDGKIVWANVNATIIRDDKGRPVRTMATIEDITDHKKMEEERRELEARIQRSEKMEALGLLAGGVAHDLNNALGILIGYAEFLHDDLDKFDPRKEDARNILKGGEQAAAIVQDLLTLARRGVQTKTVVNLNKVVSEYLKSPDFLKITSFHPNIRIRTELDNDLLMINASTAHLSKTLINLVTNAAEAMPVGGKIVVRTENRYLDKPISGYDKLLEGDYVVLTVSDDDMKHIFEPFYTKKVMGKSGTGLGLSVVWGTVKDHDGYIDVESQKGKGTTFIIYFPVTYEDLKEDKLASPEEYLGSGERILVVDDVEGQRTLASRILNNLNYKVETVSSGEEAVEYLKENDVDIIVLDMIMDPGIDGFDTYQRIKEFKPDQKAIIVSGFAETERVKMAQALGAGAFVKKPYIRERIGVAIRKELDVEIDR
ncbi:MAG: Sensor histidine kinase RcsC [Syntrophus sp. SKADARSKE-3]|nr:Sensor histidine kinase RcsC [Syntrophus sp. SKADARSKE-3]